MEPLEQVEEHLGFSVFFATLAGVAIGAIVALACL